MTSFLSRFTPSEFLKNVFTLVSAASLSQAIALAIYPVLSRIYTPEEHGLFALYMSIISVTAIISTGKYELAIMIPKKEEHAAGLTVLSIFLSLVFSLALVIFIACFHERVPNWLGNENIKKWIWFIPVSTLLVGIFQSFNYWSNRRKKYRTIATANLSQSLLNSAIKLTTSNSISGGGGLILGAISGQFLGALVFFKTAFINGLESFKKIKFKDLKHLAGEYKLFPRYNMLHYAVNNFSSALPVFVLGLWFSYEQAGYYSIGFMMVHRPMNLLSSSFTQVFSQKIIGNFNNGILISKQIRKFVFMLFLIAFLPFVIAAIWGPGIFSFVFGVENNWYEAGVFMRILLPWLFVVFISAPLSFLPDMLKRQKKAMWIDILKFILRIAALSIGVILKDIYLVLMIFSGISFIMVSYSLYWYLNLSGQADQINRKLMNSESE